MSKANRIILFGGVVMSLVVSNVFAAPPAVSQVRPGSSTGNVPVLTVQGNKVYRGASNYGSTQYTIDKNMIQEGSTGFGRAIVTADGKGNVHKGYGTYGQTIATVRDGKIQEGASGFGRVLGTTNGGDISGAAGAALLLSN